MKSVCIGYYILLLFCLSFLVFHTHTHAHTHTLRLSLSLFFFSVSSVPFILHSFVPFFVVALNPISIDPGLPFSGRFFTPVYPQLLSFRRYAAYAALSPTSWQQMNKHIVIPCPSQLAAASFRTSQLASSDSSSCYVRVFMARLMPSRAI